MSTFTVEAYQNEYLPLGGSEVNAIVTVTSDGAAGGSPPPDMAELLIIDTSGSMGSPDRKIKSARQATGVAIDCIRDGVAFAVIAGSDHAYTVYPPTGGLTFAARRTRIGAKEAVKRLTPSGGTAIGSWLRRAAELAATAPGRACHAILLTDGENQHEDLDQLDAALAEVEGKIQCDCRGVGTDWRVSELRRIASRLLGSVDIIARPEEMAADFGALMRAAMGKTTANVSLRLWTPQGAAVAFVRQVSPSIEDLTDRAARVNALTVDYPTATWGAETRDYHVCIEVPPREPGEEMLAARVTVLAGEEPLGQALVRAVWTEDSERSTQIQPEVAHYTGQAELAACIQEGVEARQHGDPATATFKLGRAVQLAAASGNEGTLKLLEAVVDVEDAASGTVRLRRDIAIIDEMSLDTRSTATVRVGPGTT